MSRTCVIADVHGRFDLLLRAMEAISTHARERRTGSIPELKIVILGNIERGSESEQFVEYLAQEQLSRGVAPIIPGGLRIRVRQHRSQSELRRDWHLQRR